MLRMTGICNCSLRIKIAASCFTNHQRDATTNKVVTCFLLVLGPVYKEVGDPR